MFLRILLFIIITTIVHSASAQTRADVDSLLLETHRQNHKEGNTKKAIQTAYNAVELSQKINYDRGLSKGYYTIAVLLSDTRNFEKSIEYIEKAKKYKKYLSTNRNDEFNLLMLEASNNYELGFYALAAAIYKQARAVILKEKDGAKRKHHLMIFYINAHLGFEELAPQYVYYLKANELSDQIVYPEHFPKAEILVKKADLYEKMGYVNLENGHLDSARYYYNKSLEIAKVIPTDLGKAIALASLGMVAEEEKNYKEALTLTNQAEEILKEHSIFSNLRFIYGTKQRIYNKLGETEKERDYLLLQRQLTDSMERVKNKGRDNTLMNLINEKEAAITQSATQHKLIIYSITSGAILLLIGTGYYFRKFRKKKQYLLQQKDNKIIENDLKLKEKEQLLEEKEVVIKNSLETIASHSIEAAKFKAIIEQTEQQTQVLQLQVNASFDEIIALAKENSPQFLPRFQEIYPLVISSLLIINSDLKATELTLCAYIYLNFSSKEIAEFTFKSVRTIQTRKSDLRKRLLLPSNTDLYIWMQQQ